MCALPIPIPIRGDGWTVRGLQYGYTSLLKTIVTHLRKVKTKNLEVAYLEWGPSHATPVILLHGWPSDAHDWDVVAPVLAQRGLRVLVPTLRGVGQPRVLHAQPPRTGPQAALAARRRAVRDARGIASAFLAGYDWGGRAACIVAALWPQRVQGLVSITGYNIQDLACAHEPAAPQTDRRFWYQWYFQTARGEAALVQRRSELAKCLWQEWSPNWQFDEATFAASAESFEHPDFVAVTVHSYRHRYGNAPGDPVMDLIESELARQPVIKVPKIVLLGA